MEDGKGPMPGDELMEKWNSSPLSERMGFLENLCRTCSGLVANALYNRYQEGREVPGNEGE